jgi:hypothetical protein
MLKVVLTVDCDFCREPFWSAAVCSDPETDIWESFAIDLTAYVQSYGWDFDESTRKFKCDSCIEMEEDESERELVFSE